MLDVHDPCYIIDDREHAFMTHTNITNAGKYSFYPASSQLWQLDDQEVLRDSYKWTTDLLERYGLASPSFPDVAQDMDSLDEPKDKWFLKPYPSHYIPLEERLRMTHDLYVAAGGTDEENTDRLAKDSNSFMLGWVVEGWSYKECNQRFEMTLRQQDSMQPQDQCIILIAKYAIFAGGRFFPLLMSKENNCPKRFLRIEVGVRVEDSSDSSFWREIGGVPNYDNLQLTYRTVGHSEGLDPKYKFLMNGCSGQNHPRIEWRTFCCCRSGRRLNVPPLDIAHTFNQHDQAR